MNATEMPIDLLLGTSQPMRELAEQIEEIARSDRAALLVGETGVGKSRIARTIHAMSPRAAQPYREIECGMRPVQVLEMQWHGAGRTAEGSVYLEEIADLPVDLQGDLLASLDEPHAHARVIAGSEKDLATEVTELRFNEALYYRLGAMPLHLPPLRARSPEDLHETTLALVRELRRGLPDAPRDVSDRAQDVIARYPWPGNMRELRNVLDRALMQARGESCVDVQHLSREVLDASGDVSHAHVSRTLAEVERTHIERTLRAHDANRTRAARELGISRATLIKKIREYEIADRQPRGLASTQESA